MAERTEEAALGGFLEVSVGGEPVRLDVLPWEESDAWLAAATRTMSDYEPPESADAAAMLHAMVRAPLQAMFDLVCAWDKANRLGDHQVLRQRIRPDEIKAAFEAVADVADPFGELSRLAGVAYGQPLRVVRNQMSRAIDLQLQRATSMSTPSANGTPRTTASAGSGPRSSSGSAGRTRSTGSSATPGTTGT